MKYFLIIAGLLMAAVGCKTGQDTSASFVLNNDVDSLSFAIGQSIGSNLGRQDMTDLDPDLIAHGIRNNLAGEGWDEMAVQATIETMLRERQERDHLQAEPRVERRGQAKACSDPAGAEVRHHARDLVKNEEIGQLHRTKAQGVEVQQHQHTQGPVGQHKAPIGRRNSDIGCKALWAIGHSD